MFDIYTTLNDIQNSTNIASICDSVIKILKNSNKNQIIDAINIFLIQGKKTNLTKFLYFFDKLLEEFNTSENESEDFEKQNSNNLLIAIKNHLENTIDSKNKNIRKNTLILLNILFKHIEPEEEFIVYLCERLYDKEKEVVKKAVCLLSKHQNVKINKKDYVYNVYKDLLKHDPNGDVRRLVLRNIETNDRTITSIIERCIDTDNLTRNVFYNQTLEKIKLKELKIQNLEFLLEKCMKEREVSCKNVFVDKVIIEFNLIDNFLSFIDTYNVDKEFLCLVFDKINVKFTNLPVNVNQAKVYNIYLDYIENKDGRDFLVLFDLEKYLEHIKKSVNDSILLCELLKTLQFYDFVTQNDKQKLKEFLNEILQRNTCDYVNDAVFTLIKKYMLYNEIDTVDGVNNKITTFFKNISDNHFVYIFKYNLCADAFEYFYNKIKDRNDEVSLMCFFYICKNDHNFEIPSQILHCKDIKILTDLFIVYKISSSDKESIIRGKLDVLLYEGIKNNETGILVPIMKLLISGYVQENEFLEYVLQSYYTNLDDHLYQYTTLFLHEYFINDAEHIIDVFVNVFTKIDKKKIFVNQSLFWIANSFTVNGLQKLCYKICLYLFSESITKKIMVDLINVLNNVECANNWEPNLTKKMLYCAGQIIKKIETKTLLNNFIAKLTMIDDGALLSKEEIEQTEQEISNIKNQKK